MRFGDKVSIVAHDGSVQPAQVTRVQPSDGGFGAATLTGIGGDRWFLFSTEGTLWVPGWGDSAANALRTVAALSREEEPALDDDEFWAAIQAAAGRL